VGDSSKPIREREAKLKAVRKAAEYSFPTADIAQMLEEIERGIVQAGTNPASVPAAELAGLRETAHLLRSPKNARRLLTAFRRAGARRGKPESIEKLRREMGLGTGR
jgi:antitoxin YefM